MLEQGAWRGPGRPVKLLLQRAMGGLWLASEDRACDKLLLAQGVPGGAWLGGARGEGTARGMACQALSELAGHPRGEESMLEFQCHGCALGPQPQPQLPSGGWGRGWATSGSWGRRGVPISIFNSVVLVPRSTLQP